MICSDCSRQFKTAGGLARHRSAAHPAPERLARSPQPPGRVYFYAADIEVTVNGQVIKATSVEFDSTKDQAPRVTEGWATTGKPLKAAR